MGSGVRPHLRTMAQGHRPDRVGDQIRETLSEMLTRGAVHDPGIGFITITRVKVSADLQMARVFCRWRGHYAVAACQSMWGDGDRDGGFR